MRVTVNRSIRVHRAKGRTGSRGAGPICTATRPSNSKVSTRVSSFESLFTTGRIRCARAYIEPGFLSELLIRMFDQATLLFFTFFIRICLWAFTNTYLKVNTGGGGGTRKNSRSNF